MSGCMRDVLDSRIDVEESREGKVKGLAVTIASICSIEDSIILARAFSTKASYNALQSAQPHNERRW